ncbi:transglycosylase SLT domain-containing protein [Acinetobacter sp. ANC 5383]
MAASLGRLTLDLVTRISSFTEPLDRAENKAKQSTEAISSSFDQAGESIKKMAATIATAAASYVSLEKIIEVQRNFDKLNASLITSTGSVKNAAIAFSTLQDFAKTTPYDLNQSIEAFTKLVNLGLNPSERALRSYGNTSAAMGKDLIDMVEAVADASTGEFERLKAFGITASQNGGKVAFTFQGTTKVIENSGKEIEKYLMRIGEVNFADAASNRLKTLDGSISNLQDTFESFLLKVSQSGIGDGVKTGVDAASDALTKLSDNLETAKEVTIVFGAYMVGAAIPATKKYVTGVYEKIAALITERQQILLNTEIEAVKAARTAHLTGIELTNAEAQMLRLSGMQRLAFVESTLIPLQTAHAAALEADTAAQAANNAAKLTAANVGKGLIGVLNGPVGLGLTVAAVAASYFLLKDSTKDVPQVLDTQGKSVDEVTKKWQQLNAVQKDTAINQLTKKVEDLRVKYVTASSDLSAYIGYIEDSGRVSEKVAQQIQQQYQKYLEGKITADQFYTSVKSINGVSDEQVTKIRNLISTNDAAKTSYMEQNDLLGDLTKKSTENSGALDGQKKSADALSKSTDALSQFQKKQNYTLTEQARVLGLTAENWGKLTKAQQDYATKVATDVGRQAYINENMKNGKMTREQADFMASQHESMGVSFYTPLTKAQQQVANKAWGTTGNFTFTKTELARIAKVNGIASAHNFAQIESLYGLPKGTLAAYVLGESGGNANATSPTGAYGLFQTTGIFRKQYGLSKGSSVESQATAVADAIAKGVEEFGNLPDALRSLNAGIAGTKQYLSGNIGNGKGQMSPAKAKEVAGYAPKFAKNYAGVTGKATIDNSVLMPSQADMLTQQAAVAEAEKAQQDKALEIRKKYYTKEQQLAQDNTDAIKEINSALTGSDQTNALAKQAELYQSQLKTLHAQEKDEYNQLHAFETDRITQLQNEYAVKKQLAEADLSKSPEQRKDAAAALDRKMQAEIDAVKREEAQQVLSAKQATMDSIEFMKQQYAIERDEIVKNKALSDQARKEILSAKDAGFQQQIDAIKREEAQQVMSAFEAYMNETEIVVKRYAVERDEINKNYKLTKETRAKLLQANSMAIFGVQNSSSDKVNQFQRSAQEYLLQQSNPNAYAAYDFQNQYSNDLSNLNQAYANQKVGIENDPLANQQQIEKSLLDAHEQYLQAKQTLDEEYASKQNNLLNTQYQNQLDSLNTLVSSTSSSWSSMTGIVKDKVGEQSSAYKSMYAVQQAFAIASATINAFQAYSQIMASPWYLDIISKETAATAVLAMGMANVGMITAQAITGFSSGGYTGTGGKYDVAGIVHKGEVVWSQEDVARSGGVGAVERARRGGISGYADGGVVGGFAGLNASASQSRIANQLSEKATNTTTVQPQHLVINNLVNWDEVPDVMAGSSGQKVTLNTISRNRTQIRRILGL